MLARTDCIPCYFRQALSSAQNVDAPVDRQIALMYEVAKLLPELTLDVSPAHNSNKVLRMANEFLGVDDPYLDAKRRTNDMALGLYPRLTSIVDNAFDPLEMAAKLSVVGNVLDLGIKARIDIDETIGQVIKKGFAVDHLPDLLELLESPRSVLLLVDNSGEIVFDMLFVEHLKAAGHDVVVGVKSGPILNDATMADAVHVGLDKVTDIIETGSDWIGTDLATCSDDFRDVFMSSDIVIAKGQANYETIEGARDNLFIILKAKCESVADNIGVDFGDLVFLKSAT